MANPNYLEALRPLFLPWEEPDKHRVPNEVPGKPAVVKHGRRLSRCDLVRSLRSQVDVWRDSGYPGISGTSNHLLQYWFAEDNCVKDENGNSVPFRYHWAQREAIETIIFCYELRGIKNVASLLLEFGEGKLDDLAQGIDPEDDMWARYCAKVATGGGKTKIMSLAIVWSYFHRLREANSNLAQHFVLIAPNLTVYERLKDDFENGKIFSAEGDPCIPPEWVSEFQFQVVLQDEPGGQSTIGALYLTNIHRLYSEKPRNVAVSKVESIFGPNVIAGKALDSGVALRDRISSHPAFLVLNDEAHHLHDSELAWNKAIESLHLQAIEKGNEGICMQLDFSATPKHNTDARFFNHIVCDFPLGEAVDAGIVKVPILGESNDLVDLKDADLTAAQRYTMHLNLGYELYGRSYEEFHKISEPILFVMTEDTDAANDIAAYLDSDKFPLLKGRVLNIHTKVKGKIKTVKRGGREFKEFVESETAMKPEDLKDLRLISRELDKRHSKYRCVVSVLMLREGWDVRNVTTIVPLRPYSAKSGILPEQTLGRGLRRMFPGEPEKPEKVVVVHHPAFKKLYQEELEQEGFDILSIPIREIYKETVTIFVDKQNKAVESLDIEIPAICDSIESTAELPDIDFEEIRKSFSSRFHPLPVGETKTGEIEYEERHLFTEEVIGRWKLDAGLLNYAYSATSYFAQMLGKACHLSNPHAVLEPLISRFIREVLFERKVDLFAGEVDHRMRDADVLQHIRATFTPIVLEKTIRKHERKRVASGVKLSGFRPYQATSTEKRPAVQGTRTLFNLIPCDNEFEQSFVDFCDYASDVVAFAKNSGPQKLMIDYLKPDGHRSLYVPDFFVRCSNGKHYLVELKGKVDDRVSVKAQSAIEWCKSASKDVEWEYLYVPYLLFQNSSPTSIEDLARACIPSLKELLTEAKTMQAALPLEEEKVEAAAEAALAQVLEAAGATELVAEFQVIVKDASETLNFLVSGNRKNFAPALAGFLGPFDKLALNIIVERLKSHVPDSFDAQRAFFSPSLDNLEYKAQPALLKNQRHLSQIFTHGRSVMLLGTLAFCLSYAQTWNTSVSGVWRAVEQQFGSEEDKELYEVLSSANEIRNTKVAHVEAPITDSDEAFEALITFTRCLYLLSKSVR